MGQIHMLATKCHGSARRDKLKLESEKIEE